MAGKKGTIKPNMRGNKNASKKSDEIILLIKAYIKHRAEGFSKKSFPDCDYETVEKHLNENIEFRPLKKELEKAEREGLKYWEQLGKDIASGEIKGNPVAWIFTMKNKFPEEWKEKQTTEVTGDRKSVV